MIRECDVPAGSALGRDAIGRAYYRDSWQAPLTRPDRDIVEIYTAIFAHAPLSMKLLMIVRNAVVRPFGLKAPPARETLRGSFKAGRTAGETIGRWPIHFASADEIIAGFDDKHQDFRVSVFALRQGETASVVLTTICTVHNFFGKAYLFFILPYHRYGVRKMLANAVAAGRL